MQNYRFTPFQAPPRRAEGANGGANGGHTSTRTGFDFPAYQGERVWITWSFAGSPLKNVEGILNAVAAPVEGDCVLEISPMQGCEFMALPARAVRNIVTMENF